MLRLKAATPYPNIKDNKEQISTTLTEFLREGDLLFDNRQRIMSF